jgi:hypothetical protein
VRDGEFQTEVAELLRGLQSTRETSEHDLLVVEEWALSLSLSNERC